MKPITVESSEIKENGNAVHMNPDHSLYDLIASPVAYITPDYCYQYINKEFLEWFGLEQKNIIGKHVEEFLGVEAFHIIKPYMDKAFNGIKVHFEKEIPYKQGSRFVEATYTPDIDELGKVKGYVALLNDLTGRKKITEALEKSEVKFKKLVSSLPAAFYTTDKDGYITYYNDSAVKLWGREPEIGKDKWCGSYKIFETDGVTEISLDKCPMAIALKEKRNVVMKESFIVQRPDGDRRYFIPHPEPIFDSKGNMIGAMNMLMDVTELKIAEEQSARLAAIVHSSSDAIISKNIRGIITSWNKAAEKIFGFTTEEMVGQSITKIIPIERQDEEQYILTKIKNGEILKTYETKRLTKSGKVLDVSLTISPVKNWEGKIIGASKIARDITQQKEAKRLIKEKEEHLRMAIEAAHLGTWEYDPVSFKLKCSEGGRKICGLTADLDPDFELIAEQIHEEDKDLFYQQIKSAVDPNNDGKFDMQLRIYRYSDKVMRWVRAQGIVFFNLDKQPSRLIGILLDITEDKQREQELMNSMEMFQTMADNVPAMIWMSGTDKFDDYFNRTWLEFTGRTLETEENEGWLDNVHPGDIQNCIDTYTESLKEQKGFYTEYRLRRNDGHYRWIADNAVPRFSPNGEFLGFISACIDIDDQKRFREKIQASEQLFKTISNAAPVMIWMSGTDKLCNFFNHGWLDFTGRTVEQESGNGWTEGIHPDDRDRYLHTYQSSFDTHKNFNIEYRLRRYDGEYRWVSVTGAPLYSTDGTFTGYIGSGIDVHETKIHEQRKDDFIKMASHELKTPITSIHGYVQLLLNIFNEQKSESTEPPKKVIKTSLQTIEKQVGKLTRLISELLDLSKIESGKLELRKTEFKLEELLEEIVQEARHVTSQHAIIFRSDFDGVINADRDRIAQVILNLLSNAIKYSPEADKVKVHLKADDEFASIEVTDFGIGIDKKDQQKIFERFYRVEGKEEQTFPGFGIGLFIASEIVQRHQGSITVKSQKNKGSIFTITLPIGLEK